MNYRLGLYPHNIEGYEQIKQKHDNGENIACILRATGTGKSFIGLQYSYDYNSDNIVYVVPSVAIREHLIEIIHENGLTLENDFPNLNLMTYQEFVNLSKKEIAQIKCDRLILDEFHHIGAPVWGSRIDCFIDTHPNIKILGMSAYSVRDRGTGYERDMAKEGGKELFSDKVVSNYDLCDAMIDGVLPKPIYKAASIDLISLIDKIEDKMKESNISNTDYERYMEVLTSARQRIHQAPEIPNVLKKTLKPNGKYIYFCPPFYEKGVSDIETIKQEAYNWCKQITDEENIVFYQSTSEMRGKGKKNRDAFYNDKDLEGNDAKDKLQIMFCINQYNEGVHAPNIDGVILGRATGSDIVYFEQIGRALAVKGNTKEMYDMYDSYSFLELKEICYKRDIKINDDMSKEELIQKLIAPLIIDLTNNYSFIKELEDNLKDRIKKATIKNQDDPQERKLRITDASFDIEVDDYDLYKTLMDVYSVVKTNWDVMFEYAKIYYDHHKKLEVVNSFRTTDGYTQDDEGPIRLGFWIRNQRTRIDPESERGQRLLSIGMRFEKKKAPLSWDEMYKYLRIYHAFHGNANVKTAFRTNDGINNDPNGEIPLGSWLARQRLNLDVESEKGKKLSLLGIEFKRKQEKYDFDEMFKYAKIYSEHNNGQLNVPRGFRTNDGFTRDDNGKISLGTWINDKRRHCNPESKQGKMLQEIGLKFEKLNSTLTWEEMYEYAKIYYGHYGNLLVPQSFQTNDGYTRVQSGEIRLGNWVSTQRSSVKEGTDRYNLLSSIGMIWNVKQNRQEVKSICNTYYIDTNTNKDILSNISIIELTCKINYLIDNNLPLTKDGKLHEIFTLSSISLQEKYNITLEDLISLYNNKKRGSL